MNPITVLYQLKSNKILLWFIDKDTLGYSFDKKLNFPDPLKNLVKKHKSALLDILQYNQVDSEEKAAAIAIYKAPKAFQKDVLSEMQKGIYLQCNLDALSHAYNVPIFIAFENPDIVKLKSAVVSLLEEYPILRMIVGEDYKYSILPIESISLIDVKISPSLSFSRSPIEQCKQRYEKAFNIHGGPLIQTEILHLEGTDTVILNLTHHHILSDAYSVGLIVSSLMKYYEGTNTQQPSSLQYADFIPFQNQILQTQDYQNAIAHLAKKIDDADILQLSAGKNNHFDNIGEIAKYHIDSSIYSKLIKVSSDSNVSLYAMLVTCLYHVLNQYNGGRGNFPIGLTVSNRPFEFKDVVGPFISTLPLIPNFSFNQTLIDNVRAVSLEIMYLNEHRHMNLSTLVDHLNRNSDDLANLMHVMFTMHNYQQDSLKAESHLLSIPEEVEKFGISITAMEENNQLFLHVSYAKQLYNSKYISSIMQSFLWVLSQVDKTTLNQPIHLISMLDSSDYRQMIHDWSFNSQTVFNQKNISQVFEELALKFPDHIALVSEKGVVTYQELNRRANQLAHYLVKTYKIEQEALICFLLSDQEFRIISMLAILKTGGAYVPISTHFPESRIQFILKDTGAQIFISQIDLSARRESLNSIVLDDDNVAKSIASCSYENLNLTPSNRQLAYVMYTSGTQGYPKGVMIEQRNVVSLVDRVNYVDITPDDCFIQLADVAFDAATFEVWGALLNGARLYLPDNTLDILTDVKKFSYTLQHQGVTVLWLTKTLFDALYLSDETLFQRLNYLLVGGEALNKPLMQKLTHSPFKPRHVINGYGPTENTTFSTTFELTIDNLQHRNTVPIGKPLTNRTAYVLNDLKMPLPIGAVGELYVGGAGVARGYLNNSELTKRSFIENPFLSEISTVLYKTGDYVRWLEDGNLEYMGRNDHQHKIRGYRIELGEIEQILQSYDGITQSIARIYEDQSLRIITAYFVSDQEIDELQLRTFLDSTLPDYMVPQVLIPLEAIPYTKNGKLDINALPKPRGVEKSSHHAPQTKLEKDVCEIWAESLGLENVGTRDSFFHLGGNSILALSITSKINQLFKSNLKARDIFLNNTVEKLAVLIKESVGNFEYNEYLIQQSHSSIHDEVVLYSPFPLTNVQQAYHLGRFSEFGLGNVSTHIYTEHGYLNLDVERLEFSLNQMLQRHLSLRTVFFDDCQQFIKEIPYYKIKTCQCADENELLNVRRKLSHKIYDPTQFPLFDVIVSKLPDSVRLHLSFDALLMDAQSFRIFFDEWTMLYENPSVTLPEIKISYRDYIIHYYEIRKSPLFQRAKQYWLQKLDDYNFEIKLPVLTHHTTIIKPTFNRVSKIVDKEIWQTLLSKTQEYNISPTVLLLWVYGKVLSFWSGKSNLCINLTLFNRLPLHPQINEITGDFTVLELFNFVNHAETNILTELKQIHKQLWDDIEHNLFDGVDFQRLIRKVKAIPANQTIAPVVFTSILGNTSEYQKSGTLIDSSYQGEAYSITQTSQVWLDNKVYETLGNLVVEWDFVEQLFDTHLIADMHHSYIQAIHSLAKLDWATECLPNFSISGQDLSIITKANLAEQPISEETLFSGYERLLQQNTELLDTTAVVDAGNSREYSYRTLLSDSERLAKHCLSSQGKLIAVLSEKGYNQVVATLAIMKSGHAYLPLNIDWPLQRLDTVLQEGEVTHVLISRELYERMDFQEAYTLLIIEELLQTPADETALLPQVKADDTAYVIFTSGSTGTPKGVTLSHRGALNTIIAVNERFKIDRSDKVLALSELSFDLSVYDLFGVLAVGGTLVIPQQSKAKDPSHWCELIERHQITLWNTVPQLADLLMDELKQPSSLRLFLLSGDWIPTSLPPRIQSTHPHSVVMSLGGATEGSIWSIWYEIKNVDPDWTAIPYGEAMPNQRMYILNADNEMSPLGVIGEIHIGGLGVALNYWKDAEKTARSFIEHQALGRLYKTGDLGRWHPDGYIEFIGRKDNQLKIRGYRVELGEIEQALASYPGIKQGVSTAIDDPVLGHKHLVAYYLADQVLDDEALEKHLRHRLPDYMIPALFIHLTELPLSN